MNRLTIALSIQVVLLSAAGCAMTGQPEAPPVEEPAPPPEPTPVVAEEFGPLVFWISPDLRLEWDRVLQLHERLFSREGRKVEEDDLHRLYNAADSNDDDVLDRTEVDEAFRRAKRDYERYLERAD